MFPMPLLNWGQIEPFDVGKLVRFVFKDAAGRLHFCCGLCTGDDDFAITVTSTNGNPVCKGVAKRVLTVPLKNIKGQIVVQEVKSGNN